MQFHLLAQLVCYFCAIRKPKINTMKKVFVFAAAAALTLSSCVSKQKYVELEEMQKATSDKLSSRRLECAGTTAERNGQGKELA